MSEIKIGLTGWGDHPTLYEDIYSANQKLQAYAGHFPIVELDTSFYAIPPKKNIDKWIQETPDSFQFIAKAYQGITGHQRGEIPFTTKKEMFDAYKVAFQPMKQAGKLAMILCQFPPWFDCQKKHIKYLSIVREQLKDFEVALEFRHQSWYSEHFRDSTLAYMKENNWIHSICDEPQAGQRSVPFVPVVTTDKAFFRFHGRNTAGWNKPVKGEEWRDVRYLYDYPKQELRELAEKVEQVSVNTNNTYVVFNNNSGGHAANNAEMFMKDLNLKYEGLAPRQLNLFEE